jgi:hypothetical protein
MAALHPNREADISRDRVLQQHIARLQVVVTPSHRDLKIPRRFQYESPWPSAQVNQPAEIMNNEFWILIYIRITYFAAIITN